MIYDGANLIGVTTMTRAVTDKIYDILELLENYTQGGLSAEGWQAQLLDKFCQHLKLDRAALFLQANQTRGLEMVSQNLLKHHDNLYLDYYHNLDPFHFVIGDGHGKKLQLGPGYAKTVVSFKDVVNPHDLQNSEYYLNFMRPQKLAHDLVVYFKSREKLLGVASLMRKPKSGDFAPDEIKLLKIAAPLVALALDNIDIKRQDDLQQQVISLLATEAATEMVIMNTAMEIVYATLNAREFLMRAHGETSVFEVICNGCRKLTQPKTLIATRKEQILKNKIMLKEKTYELSSRLMYFDSYTGAKEGFFVIMFNVCKPNFINHEKLMQTFNLTPRESEIVEAVFKGRRNSEIAGQLFISEITVKKHLQNICAKLNVTNRTAIISTILQEFGVL